MWFGKRAFSSNVVNDVAPISFGAEPLKVGILGTGKIGTDLLVKVMRSEHLECVIFAGRNLQSEGMQYAAKLGVPVSDQGIHAFLAGSNQCDIVFDATSAAHHIQHAQVLEELGIFTIDMTPSQIGECVVPAIGLDEIRGSSNISMISCGGQSSIPMAYILSTVVPEISGLEVVSVVSKDSVGPGTLANIDEYYSNTRAGLQKYTGVNDIDVDLQVSEENTRMVTSILAKTSFTDIDQLNMPLNNMLSKLQRYVPGYKLERIEQIENEGVKIVISVEGVGDYLPKYAGNLDIINCAAVAVAEEYAQTHVTQRLEMAAEF